MSWSPDSHCPSELWKAGSSPCRTVSFGLHGSTAFCFGFEALHDMRENTLAFSKDFLPGQHLSTCHRRWWQHERSRVQSELSAILEELPQSLMECVEETEERFHLVDAGVCKKLICHVEIEDFVVGEYFVANVPICAS
jgi:hypothetical protein